MRLGPVAALVVTACLVQACSSRPTPDARPEAETTASTPSSSPSVPSAPATPDAGAPRLAEVPPANRPTALARQLELALSILRDEQSSPADQQSAGEFQQLATRLIASAGRRTSARRRRGCPRTPHPSSAPASGRRASSTP